MCYIALWALKNMMVVRIEFKQPNKCVLGGGRDFLDEIELKCFS